MSKNLTPYDTGERLVPKTWVTSTAGLTRDNINDFGKVDFDNDEGATMATVWIARDASGDYTLHVNDLSDRITVVLNDSDGERELA